jgi:hypothetical protein
MNAKGKIVGRQKNAKNLDRGRLAIYKVLGNMKSLCSKSKSLQTNM